MVVLHAPCALRLEMTIGRVKPVAIETAVPNISLPRFFAGKMPGCDPALARRDKCVAGPGGGV